MTDTTPITREVYEAFQRVELHRWDAVIAADVLVNSPAAYEWERNWPVPHNVRAEPLVAGIDRGA